MKIINISKINNMRRAIKTCKHKILLRMLHQYDSLSVVNVHVDELSSARIWQHKLCPQTWIRITVFQSKYTTVFVLLDISESK